MAQQTKVVCPICGMNRMASSYERNDETAFGTWDENREIIQIRDAPGGKAHSDLVGTGKYRRTPGRGFPIINTFSLDEAIGTPEYAEYVMQQKQQLLKVMKIYKQHGIVTDAELQSL